MRVLYVSMLAEPGHYNRLMVDLRHTIEGCDDSCWLAFRLIELGMFNTKELVRKAQANQRRRLQEVLRARVGRLYRRNRALRRQVALFSSDSHAKMQDFTNCVVDSITTVCVSRGEKLPNFTSSRHFDAVVVGGSFHSVEDNKPWQLELGGWLRQYRNTGRPLLGICGGHQLMAFLLGGTIGRRGDSKSGPIVHPHSSVCVSLSNEGAVHPLFAGFSLGHAAKLSPVFHFGNNEHVVELPQPKEGCYTVLASTRDSPAVAVDYGGGWLGVQFHPEASHLTFQSIVATCGEPELAAGYHEGVKWQAARLLENFFRMCVP